MLSKYEFDELPRKVQHELLNPKYRKWKHASHSTYSDGCSGPLCLKAERDRSRRRYRQKRAQLGKPQVKERPIARLDFEEEERIDAIVEWYLANRETLNLAA
jgi:hypothetical protein